MLICHVMPTHLYILLGNVTGFATGFFGVQVRVETFVPSKNPYPSHGLRVTRAVTRHITHAKLSVLSLYHCVMQHG